ncbi:MAG: agmatine deiminase family protein [Deltaproteobacteria bacterium]|nr:MAG: agmatine deiminase family protein [Deltaproteobacteria bacterium]
MTAERTTDAGPAGRRAAVSEAAGPAAAGYRWPAEWEPHAATWLSWPHNAETWPGDRLARVRLTFAAIARALQAHERVCINVADEAMEADARRCLAAAGVDAERGISFLRNPSDDAWLRDCGPIFVVRERPGARERALLDFRFDAWGGKYPPWDRDDALPRRLAAALQLPRFESALVLEGGSIDGNGRGTALVTESCLLHPNRGRGRTRETLERALAELLGVRCALWLGGGIEGDDTDGHVDDVARFVDANTVVAAIEPDRADRNHAPLADNLRRLRGMRDAEGKPLSVVTLPMPPRLEADGVRLPASYANFYLANGVALVPTFGAASDARALAVLRELLPGRDVIGIECTDLVYGLGAIHCVTQQEPAA